LCKDGTEIATEITATSRWNEKGEYAGHICVVRDITERKRAEEKIRQSEEFIRGILDTVDEGFIVIGRDYRILTANKAYCAQVGQPVDEVIGKHCYELSHKVSRPCYEEGEECAVRQVFATGRPHAALHKHPDREGHILYVETKGFPIKDASGAVTSVIETINNITERHLLEEERLKTQKLESIGTLAGGIAHDFNNLLQGIFGYISMAKLTIDQREKSLAMLVQAEKALHQSVNLTSQLLTFSKGGKPVKKVIDLRPVIENAATFALSGSRSDVRLDIGPGLWHTDADGGQMGQVIQNIVLNADQAMPLGGRVAISARNLPASETASHPGLESRDYVVIGIEDQGVGIPQAYLDKIFDPYFTTKEKGSGLGLATSYSIIRNHGGRIEVRSVVGTGSTFLIYLPAVSTEASLPAERPHPAPARKARVLVMDDESVIRLVAQALLGSLGHDVEAAENGDAAVGLYRRAIAEGRPFDVVILDLTVRGGKGGAETLRELLEIDPGVKAIVSSGYSDDEVIATYLQHGFCSFLKKPYDVQELSRVLDGVMA
jgi:PAS domain S-box-containing protein